MALALVGPEIELAAIGIGRQVDLVERHRGTVEIDVTTNPPESGANGGIDRLFRVHLADVWPDYRTGSAFRLCPAVGRRPLAGLQLHTVARATAKSGCHPLPLAWLQDVAEQVQKQLGLSVDVHGGIESGSIADPEGTK